MSLLQKSARVFTGLTNGHPGQLFGHCAHAAVADGKAKLQGEDKCVIMLAFIWQDDLIGVAKFVNACLHKMNPFEGQAADHDQPGVAGRDVMCSDLIISVSYSLLCISVQGTSNSMRSDLANCSLCKGSGSSYS